MESTDIMSKILEFYENEKKRAKDLATDKLLKNNNHFIYEDQVNLNRANARVKAIKDLINTLNKDENNNYYPEEN